MPRTKSPIIKSVRTKPPADKWSIQNMGGFLLNPPSNCQWRVKAKDGGVWTDLACCNTCCKNQCDHFHWFKAASAKQRNRYWKKHGVRYFIFSDHKC